MKKIIILGISSFILWSCNNNSAKSIIHQDTEMQIKYQHNENEETIELNNGEKWEVNQEMKPFILKGSDLVNSYIQNNQSDYKALAQQIKDLNNQLIKSCTMEGKSHDELHKWLHPHLKLVKELENETDTAKANKIILQLQDSYLKYHQYFN